MNKHLLKTCVGIFLLILMIAINLYWASQYYELDTRDLPDFFIWQTNIER